MVGTSFVPTRCIPHLNIPVPIDIDNFGNLFAGHLLDVAILIAWLDAYFLLLRVGTSDLPTLRDEQPSEVPVKAAADALHSVIATFHRADFLLTWNCKHITNAEKQPLIERICRQHGYEPPVLCTSDELFLFLDVPQCEAIPRDIIGDGAKAFVSIGRDSVAIFRET